MAKKSSAVSLHPRLRVMCGEEVALGPGKVDLLAFVEENGSIRQAAQRMGMSYMRAWMLIKEMNACFKKPLVETARGGQGHGGATLTETGRQALRIYKNMEEDCLASTKREWKQLKSLLRNR